MERETIQLNKIKDPDDHNIVPMADDVSVETEIEVKGFEQIEEDRSTRFVAEDFVLKRTPYGMWRIVVKRGGLVPPALRGQYTDEKTANTTVGLYLYNEEIAAQAAADVAAKIAKAAKDKRAAAVKAAVDAAREEASIKAEADAIIAAEKAATNPNTPEIKSAPNSKKG